MAEPETNRWSRSGWFEAGLTRDFRGLPRGVICQEVFYQYIWNIRAWLWQKVDTHTRVQGNGRVQFEKYVSVENITGRSSIVVIIVFSSLFPAVFPIDTLSMRGKQTNKPINKLNPYLAGIETIEKWTKKKKNRWSLLPCWLPSPSSPLTWFGDITEHLMENFSHTQPIVDQHALSRAHLLLGCASRPALPQGGEDWGRDQKCA